MSIFPQAWRHGQRDWRLVETRLLALALIVAVMAVTSVSFFTDRVNRAMRSQATSLLGADLMITSSRPIPADYVELATALKLSSARTISFASVALAGERTQLSQIKAVSDDYPLRGQLTTKDSGSVLERTANGIPQTGEAWAEQRVLQQLELQTGNAVSLGNSTFRITRIITLEPDRGGSIFQLAPRILINHQDLEATGLLTPASRASYTLLIAGNTPQVERFQRRIKSKLQPYEQLQTIDEGRPEVTAALERASHFMGLASILTVILSGAAVALAAHGFSRRETPSVAILRSLGATRQMIYTHYGLRLLRLVCVATLIGSLLGYLAQFVLSSLLQDWWQVQLPMPRAWPLIVGFGTATLTLLGFALPPLLRLVHTPPMRILRSESAAPPVSIWLTLLAISVALLLLLSWQAGEVKLAAWIFAGVAGALIAMLFAAYMITLLLRKLPSRGGTGWRLGMVTIGRFAGRSALLIATFGVGFLTLTLLSGVRDDLMRSWENNIPPDAPNHFLINIQPTELAPLKIFFNSQGITQYKLYPMVRGRLAAINSRNISADDYESEHAQRLLNREFFLSTSDELPKANTIINGKWFSTELRKGFSAEIGIADTLTFGLGDTLTFDIAGQTLSSEIVSLRDVKWDSMQPNFFVLAAPGLLDALPTAYITSIHLAEGDKTFVTDLVQQFPSVTVLDVRAILNQVRRIIDQASHAVEYVFLFALIAGIVVLLAAIQTQRAERQQEIAILKTLGASTRQIQTAVASEFLILGGLAGLFGSGLALLTGWILARQVFDLEFQTSAMQLWQGALTGSLLLGTAGLIMIRKIIRTSPMRLLQKT